MSTIEKTSYEEIFRICSFTRTDGRGWLNGSETITTPEVLCIDSNATDVSAAMISDVAVYNNTSVKYKLKAGTAGSSYTIKVRAITSNAQKLEEVFQLSVQ